MTRLFDAPHGQLHEFEKRLQAAGLTAEHVKMLLADDPRLRAWVAKVDENVDPEPPLTRVPIEAAFRGKGRIMRQLLRMYFLYLDEVALMTEREFMNLQGFGPTSLRKMEAVLSQHGLKFGETYVEPSVVVHSDNMFGPGFYRPRIMSVELWQLVSFRRIDHWVSTGPSDTTLAAFVAMSREQQLQILTEQGVAEVEALISNNGL